MKSTTPHDVMELAIPASQPSRLAGVLILVIEEAILVAAGGSCDCMQSVPAKCGHLYHLFCLDKPH